MYFMPRKIMIYFDFKFCEEKLRIDRSHTIKVDKGESQEVWQLGSVNMEFNSKEEGGWGFSR